MSLTWFNETALKADEIEAKRKEEWNANIIRPPTPGCDIQVNVCIDKEPASRSITSDKNGSKKQFVVHMYDSSDGRVFECFDSLHYTIARALNKKADRIASDHLSHVLLHIQNVGEGKKDKWVVVPLVGV